MILVIDNYDSFVHNLARYLRELGWSTQVVRNDGFNLDEIAALKPSHIVISPGPCTPNEAGISVATVRRFGPSIPILAFASAIKASARPSAAGSSAPGGRCMARRR